MDRKEMAIRIRRKALVVPLFGTALLGLCIAVWQFGPELFARFWWSHPRRFSRSLGGEWVIETRGAAAADGWGMDSLLRVHGGETLFVDQPREARGFPPDCVVYSKWREPEGLGFWMACGDQPPRLVLEAGNDVWDLGVSELEKRIWVSDHWEVVERVPFAALRTRESDAN